VSDILRQFFAGVKTIIFVPYALKDRDGYTAIVRDALSKLGKFCGYACQNI
jgi:peptidase E